jgi:hypothetical protein
MSTLDGLVRFDGLRFRILSRQNTPALALWAGAAQRGKPMENT